MELAISSHYNVNSYWFEHNVNFMFYDLIDSFIKQYGEITHKTCSGIEKAADNPHLHIHYIIKQTKKMPCNLAQTLKYQLSKHLKEKIPPKSYGMKYTAVNKLRGTKEQHLRYVLKEVPDFDRCIGFTETELLVLSTQAKEQYRLSLEEHTKKEDKKANEEKAWRKMCEYMDNVAYDTIVHYEHYDSKLHACIEAIIDYKINECDGKGLCHSIKNQALRYLAKRKVLEKDQIYRILFSK